MRYYTPGDDIFFFGFSRGAYTARFLAEMLDHVGLLSVRLYSPATSRITNLPRPETKKCVTSPGSRLILLAASHNKLMCDSEHFKSGSVALKAIKKRRKKRRSSLSLCARSGKPSVDPFALSAFLVSSTRSTVCRTSRARGCSEASFHTRQEVQRASYGMLSQSTSGVPNSVRILFLKPNQTTQCFTNGITGNTT
jgi:hypothetical protein